MVKEQKISLMDKSILGVGRMVKYGTEQNTTNTETSYTGGWMEKESIITSMLSSDNIVEKVIFIPCFNYFIAKKERKRYKNSK